MFSSRHDKSSDTAQFEGVPDTSVEGILVTQQAFNDRLSRDHAGSRAALSARNRDRLGSFGDRSSKSATMLVSALRAVGRSRTRSRDIRCAWRID